MVRTDPYAFPAVNAEFVIDLRLSVSHPDRLGRAPLDAVDTAHAQVWIKPYRMIKFIHLVTSFPYYCPRFLDIMVYPQGAFILHPMLFHYCPR